MLASNRYHLFHIGRSFPLFFNEYLLNYSKKLKEEKNGSDEKLREIEVLQKGIRDIREMERELISDIEKEYALECLDLLLEIPRAFDRRLHIDRAHSEFKPNFISPFLYAVEQNSREAIEKMEEGMEDQID